MPRVSFRGGKFFAKKQRKLLTNQPAEAIIGKHQKSGCGAAGSALDWGSRGREFKSRHSDHAECPYRI